MTYGDTLNRLRTQRMLIGRQIRALRAAGRDWAELDGHLTVVLRQISDLEQKLNNVEVVALDEVEVIEEGAWRKASLGFF